ncbi:hypothetical protein BDY21DRAFT_364725 [Lineolata rhizophorae]|uniref:Uncharacterized protein n=1 Tax=Lineolata rhizophorae TaxID=578093 RepID=A0A6A6NYD3_9PEZI|nr:hypothetical protein BDY21DRAFT_364725 [Lineolata rhizophorae]
MATNVSPVPPDHGNDPYGVYHFVENTVFRGNMPDDDDGPGVERGVSFRTDHAYNEPFALHTIGDDFKHNLFSETSPLCSLMRPQRFRNGTDTPRLFGTQLNARWKGDGIIIQHFCMPTVSVAPDRVQTICQVPLAHNFIFHEWMLLDSELKTLMDGLNLKSDPSPSSNQRDTFNFMKWLVLTCNVVVVAEGFFRNAEDLVLFVQGRSIMWTRSTPLNPRRKCYWFRSTPRHFRGFLRSHMPSEGDIKTKAMVLELSSTADDANTWAETHMRREFETMFRNLWYAHIADSEDDCDIIPIPIDPDVGTVPTNPLQTVSYIIAMRVALAAHDLGNHEFFSRCRHLWRNMAAWPLPERPTPTGDLFEHDLPALDPLELTSNSSCYILAGPAFSWEGSGPSWDHRPYQPHMDCYRSCRPNRCSNHVQSAIYAWPTGSLWLKKVEYYRQLLECGLRLHEGLRRPFIDLLSSAACFGEVAELNSAYRKVLLAHRCQAYFARD